MKSTWLLLTTIVVLLLSAVFVQLPLVVAITTVLLLTASFLWREGVAPKQLLLVAWYGLVKNKEVLLLLLFLALLLPLWQVAGTTKQMASVAASVLSPQFFLVGTFLVASLISLSLGSAIGTLSILSGPILLYGEQLQLPLEWSAAALLCGVFVGDRTAPISTGFQLLLSSLQLTVKPLVKAMMPSTIFGVSLACTYFTAVDFILPKAALEQVERGVQWSLALLPPFILLVSSFFFKKLRNSLLLTLVVTLLFVFNKAIDWSVLWTGADGRGGLAPMASFITFIALTGVFGQWLNDFQLIQRVLNQLALSRFRLVNETYLVLAGISLLSPNQAFPIIVASEALKPRWGEERKLALAVLISNTSLLWAAVVPWSILALMCSTLLHISTWQLIPYAIFIWSLSVFQYVVSYRSA